MEKKVLAFIVVIIVVLAATYFIFPSILSGWPTTKEENSGQVTLPPFSFILDEATSTLTWQAGDYTGSLNFRFGELSRDEAGLVAGSFAVDMASLTATDKKVESRLKSKEFFETSRFTNAEFKVAQLNPLGPDAIQQADGTVVEVERYELQGELSIHGVSQGVTIPLNVSISNGRLAGMGEFAISREVFQLGPVDQTLPNEIKLAFKLVSK